MSTDVGEAGTAAAGRGKVVAFALDDAVSVLERRDLINYLESWHNGRWYEPPVDPRHLAQLRQASPHHSSAIAAKRNLLIKHFVPHPKLSRDEFGKWALDYLVMGNAFLEAVPAISGRTAVYRNSLALQTRRGVEEGVYFFVDRMMQEHQYQRGAVFHLMEHDVGQEIYGRPEYLSAMQGLLLNENATLFRRRYYLNGAHAGFIFYFSEPTVNDEDVDAVRQALRDARGKGNFRNLFIHAPNGKKDGVQIVPISEVAAKDEFLNIKNVTRDDILAAHRVPPQLIGVVPTNNGGFGDARTAAEIFHRNEIEPLEMRFLELNAWAGEEIVRFEPYQGVAPAVAR